MRAAQRVDADLGQAEVTHLAGLHLLGHHADRVLDRHAAIEPVLVPEVDVVGAEALQAPLERRAHVLRPAVLARDPAVGELEAELGRDDRLRAATGERAAEQRLVGVGPVDLGGVEEVDPELERAMDGRDAFRLVGLAVHLGRAGDAAHAHGAEADRRDDQSLLAECALLHRNLLNRGGHGSGAIRRGVQTLPR